MDRTKSIGGVLDKLALSGTVERESNNEGQDVNLPGVGIDRRTLKYKIPKKKWITLMTCLALIEVAKESGESEWEKRYRNSYYCLDNIKTQNGQAHGLFCKNRFCLVCASIRKGTFINKLLPEIQKWEEPYFVTLTSKSQPRMNLRKWMEGMSRSFELINRRLRRRYERGTGPKPIGIRCLECNFNPIRKTYNPHLHLIVSSKEIAESFVEEWLRTWTDKYTHPNAQDLRPIRKSLDDLIETIKYGAKIFTDPDMIKRKSHRTKKPKVYAAALHEIYKSMKGRNLISTFGFKQSNVKPVKKLNESTTSALKEWIYNVDVKDWVDCDTGQLMTDFKSEGGLENLFKHRIDTSLY